jgi:hypothetical protein
MTISPSNTCRKKHVWFEMTLITGQWRDGTERLFAGRFGRSDGSRETDLCLLVQTSSNSSASTPALRVVTPGSRTETARNPHIDSTSASGLGTRRRGRGDPRQVDDRRWTLGRDYRGCGPVLAVPVRFLPGLGFRTRSSFRRSVPTLSSYLLMVCFVFDIPSEPGNSGAAAPEGGGARFQPAAPTGRAGQDWMTCAHYMNCVNGPGHATPAPSHTSLGRSPA